MASKPGPRPRESALEERVRKRLLALIDRGDVDQKTLANGTRIPPSNLSKILSGKQRITFAYLEEFCFFFQRTPAELVAEPGVGFIQLKEMEADLIARYREMEDKEKRALIDVLDWRLKKGKQKPERGLPSDRLTAAAIEVAKRYQAAPADARQLVSDALSLDARHRTIGLPEQTTDLPHRGTGSLGPARKPPK